MKRFENDCVGCPQGCINCGRKHVACWYCDDCGDACDPDELYDYDDEELCEYCVLKRIPKIKY